VTVTADLTFGPADWSFGPSGRRELQITAEPIPHILRTSFLRPGGSTTNHLLLLYTTLRCCPGSYEVILRGFTSAGDAVTYASSFTAGVPYVSSWTTVGSTWPPSLYNVTVFIAGATTAQNSHCQASECADLTRVRMKLCLEYRAGWDGPQTSATLVSS